MQENGFKRRLIAILSADAVGYSRLMSDDEERTVHTLRSHRTLFFDHIRQYNGTVIDSPGDNLLAAFASVVDALRCAVEVQQALARRNKKLPFHRRMPFRIGINLGDVIEQEGRLYGDGVNVAARLESLAPPGGICISGAVYDQVKNKISNRIDSAGVQRVKNIPEPIRVYRVTTGFETPGSAIEGGRKRTRRHTVGWTLALAAATLVATGWVLWVLVDDRSPSGPPSAGAIGEDRLSQKAAVAVLPFKNLSDDVEQEYFSDGITNDIITDLSKFSELLVIASNTVFLYKGKSVDIKRVGHELGVDYIIEGSVQKAGESVRINAQLIDTSTASHVWAERYRRPYSDIFELQGEIVQAIVAQLAIETIQHERARALRKEPHDLKAYDYLLRGYAHYHKQTRTAYNRAKAMFAKAIELDPDYAAAYVGLGDVEYGKVSYGWTEFPDKALARALEYGRKAIELDESNATAHSLVSSIYTFQNRHDLAIKEARRAIEINPNDAVSYHELGWALLWSGRIDEAIEALKVSLRLDRSSPRNTWYHLGMAYYLKEDFDKALEVLEQGVIQRPDFAGYHVALAATYARLGRDADAAREAHAVRQLDPFFSVQSFGTGFRQPAHRQAITAGLLAAGLE